MTEKFAKMIGEKTTEMMQKMSGAGFKSDENIDLMIERFEDMVTETDKIRKA